MKQYKSIDLAKFICALLIIILHTAPFSSYSKALTFGIRNIVTVFAVPLFFAISGFLFFKKLETVDVNERNKYVFNYLKRIVIMYLFWSAVYLIFVIIKWMRGGVTFYGVLEYVKDFFFEGSYQTIWFLPALFGAILLIYLLNKKLSLKKIFIIACVVYVFTLLGSSYYGLTIKIPFLKSIYDVYYSFFDSVKNAVLFGFIYVLIGGIIATSKRNNEKVVSNLIFTLIFGVLYAAEEFLIAYFNINHKGVDTIIFLVPFTFFALRLVLSINLNLSDKVCTAFRKYSILMFLTQRIPLSIIDMFFQNSLVATNSILYFIVVLTATLLISYGVIFLSKKIKFLKLVY